jgi:signal transduction histidine kinase
MRTITARRIAWSLWALTVVVVLPAVALPLTHEPNAEDWLLLPVFIGGTLASATVGALVASRRPGNPIGWLFCAVGLGAAVTAFTDEYVTRGLSNEGGLPGTTLLAWLAGWVHIPILASIPMVFLLFPTGRVRTRRWRPLAWVMVGATLVATLSFLLLPQDLSLNYLGRQRPLPNPTGIEGLGALLDKTALVGGLTLLGAALLSVIALITRFIKARGEERQQVKWLAFVAVAAALFLAATMILELVTGTSGDDPTPTPLLGDLLFIGFVLSLFVGIPAASGIAILKYRLYDLDIVVKKTVVFAILAAFITLIYVGFVVGVGALVGSRGNTALTFAATAVIAIAFQPARHAARRIADRIVYGRRATPYEVLSDFSERVAGTYATEDVLPRMAHILGAGTGAERARVWLRLGNELHATASWPDEDGARSIAIQGDQLPPFEHEHAVEVRHQGELLGALSVAMPPNDPMNPGKSKLIQDLASQAGLVLRNVRLIEELRASRQRIVSAQDEERRKLERNIHDGAQQQLVALSVKLALVRAMARKDVERADAMLGELQAEAKDAMENLRDLARGIYPPLLADQGLVAALDAQARKASIPVEIHSNGIGRYPQDVEAAVYFCTLEALQNVAKYAGASSVSIRLSATNGQLAFSVTDDGAGFDPEAISRGAGLTNMADRLAALGGDVRVESEPGRGTTVTGRVPVRTD